MKNNVFEQGLQPVAILKAQLAARKAGQVLCKKETMKNTAINLTKAPALRCTFVRIHRDLAS